MRRLADPAFQAALKDKLGVDVSESAITDQRKDLLTDLERLRDAPQLPGTLTVSALLYGVQSGRVEGIAAPQTLAELRRSGSALAHECAPWAADAERGLLRLLPGPA